MKKIHFAFKTHNMTRPDLKVLLCSILIAGATCTGFTAYGSSRQHLSDYAHITDESAENKRICDSISLLKDATVKQLRNGIVWTSTHTTWKDAPRSINVISVKLSEANRLGITCPDGYAYTSTQCKQAGAFLGINAQYFGNNRPLGFLKINGEVKEVGRENSSTTFAGGVFVMNGMTPDIKKVSGNPEAALLPDETVLCCGPLLINEGQMETMLTTDFHATPHPRSAIGITKDGRLLLVTVDGRFKDKAIGMSTTLLQELMYILGAFEALNLDGGGSTAMWIDGYEIVNHPCDGLNWENPVERAVSSIIYIMSEDIENSQLE
jgi:exopolysaccharide biosynthesis protein